LAGVDLAHLPQLRGYVAATAKAAAEVALRGPSRDPILAQWQYGLGRAAAWMSDTEGRWSGEVLSWAQGGKLLASIVASTLPLASDAALGVSATLNGDRAHLTAVVAGASSGAAVTAQIVAPNGESSDVALPSTGTDRYEADIPIEAVGSYLMRFSVLNHGQLAHAATAGLAVPYSPEYRFLGTDSAFLRELASAGGGQVVSAGQVSGLSVPAVTSKQSLALLFLALAALILPIDVAIRRLAFRPGDAAAWKEALRHAQRERPPAPLEPALARMRQRVERVRAERRGGGDGEEKGTPDGSPPGAPPHDEEEDIAARLRRRMKDRAR
jgi:hypothetical protein